MDANEAAKHLATIRRIMESASQLTVLPGRAGVAGGALALAGCVATYGLMRSFDFASMERLGPGRRSAVIALWAGLVVVAVLIDVVMTARLARRRGKNPWPRLGQLGAYAMGPAAAAGLALGVALALHGQWQMLPALSIMLYGCAVWTASVLSVHVPAALGVAFFAAGAVTLFWAGPIGLVMVAVTFGAGHIAFGAYLLSRFGE